jgi:3D (Asp-Asp-Asp) domain-containing protein
LHGRTASGTATHPGIVAADPRVLPLGSQIRVSDAGAYSGTYIVADTGRAVGGRRIDLYIPNHADARRFGRRTVRVQVLERASSPAGEVRRSARHSGRRHQRVCKTGNRCA